MPANTWYIVLFCHSAALAANAAGTASSVDNRAAARIVFGVVQVGNGPVKRVSNGFLKKDGER